MSYPDSTNLRTVVVLRRGNDIEGDTVLGTIQREIKIFTNEYEMYSQHGPFRRRAHTYVDISGERWPVAPRQYYIRNQGEIRHETVVLRRNDPLPWDIQEATNYKLLSAI